MAITLDQFVTQLEDSGIVARGTLKDFLPPQSNPQDTDELIRELVLDRKLTKFQAEEISKGNGKFLVLGNYVLLEKIGQGGMGQVFKAQHRRMERVVAVKMLPLNVIRDEAAVARFDQEVKAAAKLSHPNIVTAYDADCANGFHILVMEYIQGRDLFSLVRQHGVFPVEQAANYILQAARGLDFAHKMGVVHRDVKPSNLLLAQDGTVKVLDMGIASIGTEDGQRHAELTTPNTTMGTVDYMAPEQALDAKHADGRADIYSLGCTLFHLLIGKTMYVGDTITAKLLAHRDQPIPSLRTLRGDVPLQIESVFRKMVAKTVIDRYQSMSEVITALERCGIGEEPILHALDSPTPIHDRMPLNNHADLTTTLQPDAAPSACLTEQSNPVSPVEFGEKRKWLFVTGLAVAFLVLSIRSGVFGPINPTHSTQLLKVHQRDPGAGMFSADREFSVESVGETDHDARFRQWMQRVTALPALEQAMAVAKKLKELNPDFDGNVTEKIEHDVVSELTFCSDDVSDITPLQALPSLISLHCTGSAPRAGNLINLNALKPLHLKELGCGNNPIVDLSPLRGKQLIYLDCGETGVTDLGPLQGMPLGYLGCSMTKITDLSPLRGMPLVVLSFMGTGISDIAPLQGMNLKFLNCTATNVSDLSPLHGMPLNTLYVRTTRVANLSPLEGMPLLILECNETLVTDLRPLNMLPLRTLDCPFDPKRDAEILRSIQTLERINGTPSEKFWKDVEVQASPNTQ